MTYRRAIVVKRFRKTEIKTDWVGRAVLIAGVLVSATGAGIAYFNNLKKQGAF